MTPAATHWYHVWVGDRYHGSGWMLPAKEHFAKLAEARFDGEVRVGVVGGMSERASAIREIKSWCPEAQITVQAEEGYEQVTLEKMHAFAKITDPDHPILYMHTKGALNATPYNRAWMRAVDEELVGNWAQCAEALATHDMVGMHWLTPERFPDLISEGKPMFGGTFFWATADYLAKLPPVGGTPERPPVNRYAAESWAGQAKPNVLDLRPCWPLY
jgi:hypothetical protein